MTIIWSERYRDHDTGSHPERPARIDALQQALEHAGVFAHHYIVAPEPVAEADLELAHHSSLIEGVRHVARTGGGWIDPDTYVSPASYEVALLAAGGASAAVDAALAGRPSFALVRPPGHHAEPARAMGFCLFNNVAVAVERARRDRGLGRVAIVDWDVHHGNGTQAIYWDDPETLFVSLHQYPFYPGTGAEHERGGAGAEGTTLNIPLPAGTGDDVYQRAFEELVLPALGDFTPELLVVSAGFDAHVDDPLANMRVTTEGFRWMARAIAEAARELCAGRLALVLEGGYNLQSLSECVVAVIEEISGAYRNGASQ